MININRIKPIDFGEEWYVKFGEKKPYILLNKAEKDLLCIRNMYELYCYANALKSENRKNYIYFCKHTEYGEQFDNELRKEFDIKYFGTDYEKF